MTAATPALVSTAWLADHLTDPAVRLLDASYFHTSTGRDAAREYAASHIPGAVFFDIDVIAAPKSELPHMLPDATRFSSWARRLGIGDAHHVIAYDRVAGGGAAARVWWMFRVFGHDSVSVLDGGFGKWTAEGRAVSDRPAEAKSRHFVSRARPELVRDLGRMRANLTSAAAQVIDARSRGRFEGTEPELWPGLKSGHIPGSRSLPWTELLDPADKTLLPAPGLAAKFAAAGIDLARPLVATCGSGVTACMLALGAFVLGREDVAVYDGSWAEWGRRDDTPIAKGKP